MLVSHDRFLIRRVIQGEAVIADDSEQEEGEESETEAGSTSRTTGLARRKAVYQLKAGRLVQRDGGMRDFENSLEARLRKLTCG